MPLDWTHPQKWQGRAPTHCFSFIKIVPNAFCPFPTSQIPERTASCMGDLVELQSSSLLLLHGVNEAIPHIDHLSHSHIDYFSLLLLSSSNARRSAHPVAISMKVTQSRLMDSSSILLYLSKQSHCTFKLQPSHILQALYSPWCHHSLALLLSMAVQIYCSALVPHVTS